MTAPILKHAVKPSIDCDCNQAAPHPADPIKRQIERVENAVAQRYRETLSANCVQARKAVW